MTNLAAILSKPAADVKELPNIPAGTYRCIIVTGKQIGRAHV